MKAKIAYLVRNREWDYDKDEYVESSGEWQFVEELPSYGYDEVKRIVYFEVEG